MDNTKKCRLTCDTHGQFHVTVQLPDKTSVSRSFTSYSEAMAMAYGLRHQGNQGL